MTSPALPAVAAPALDALLRLPPYQAYSYSYPHKTAYRTLDIPRSLRDVWRDEDRRALFLYLHIPFCSYRCGFCNLFALARPAEDTVARYLDQLEAQFATTQEALDEHAFARFALGGGTPSYLDFSQLQRVFAMLRAGGVDLRDIPAGMEVSPETVDAEKMALCREAGIDRISMGIQSFSEAEVRALVRPQQREVVERSIDAIRTQGFPALNLDLIYGIAGQTVASFIASIDSALAFAPEELYLYPLYVRPLTGLGRISQIDGKRRFALQPEPVDDRLSMYRAGRDRLLSAGYTQVSMRMFRAPHAPATDIGPAYCCQDDGMVGIGCGARSYTRGLHYASEYGVSRRGVVDILDHYLSLSREDFARVDHGIVLDGDEQRRRFAMQSLLVKPGLSLSAWRARFGSEVFDELPQLRDLEPAGLACLDDDLLALTDEGFARADTLGPWLVSSAVAARMAEYSLR
ncbi:STM4012 family radical SAM protein [Lysobacter brunescens]|uniref:STM4012 family radical SAM protein n=1 Tax=Lysobacter brunescens TaxID=262323 RepID=A0ABW2YB12_9GAMM